MNFINCNDVGMKDRKQDTPETDVLALPQSYPG